MSLSAFNEVLSSLGGAIGLLTKVKDLLPDSPEKREAEISIQQAEQAVQHAEVKLAEELDYNLCKCTFPPQIALRRLDGAEICPKCGRDTRDDWATVGGGFL
jgi:hypothetical protein